MTKVAGREVPSETDFALMKATSTIMRMYSRSIGATDDESRNDGLVQIPSALHPNDEPYTEFDRRFIRPGVWQVMPVQTGDHGTPIGLFADTEKTHKFYLDILEILRKTEELEEAKGTGTTA